MKLFQNVIVNSFWIYYLNDYFNKLKILRTRIKFFLFINPGIKHFRDTDMLVIQEYSNGLILNPKMSQKLFELDLEYDET